MRSGFIVGAAASVATAVLLLAPSANAFFFHAPGAECELYETGHAATFAGTILNAIAPGTGTTDLSCPITETASFAKGSATQVFVDLFISSSGSATATACSNPYTAGSLHCGTSQSTSGTGAQSIFLSSTNLAGAWSGTGINTLDYGYLSVSLVGVGTKLLGYELD